jgi:hypothetical protein
LEDASGSRSWQGRCGTRGERFAQLLGPASIRQTAQRQAPRFRALAKEGCGPAAIVRLIEAKGARISEHSVYRILASPAA